MAKAKRKIIVHTTELYKKVKFLSPLPRKPNAKYLECVYGECDILIAKQWRNAIPMKRYEVLIAMPEDGK